MIAAAKATNQDQRTLAAIPSYYVEKIAVGPKVKEGTGMVRLGAPVEQNLEIVALKLGKRVRDLIVCLLDRPRHEKLVHDVRRTGAAIRLIGDGDVAAAIAPSMPDSNVDIYMGVGGSPEAVIAAAAIRCLGGEILARMWPRDEDERKQLEADGHGDLMKRSLYHFRPGGRRGHRLRRDRHHRQHDAARRADQRPHRGDLLGRDAGPLGHGPLHQGVPRLDAQDGTSGDFVEARVAIGRVQSSE